MKNKTMNELYGSYQDTIKQQNFHVNTTKIYESGFLKIQEYMNQNNLSLYDENVGKDFLNSLVLQENVSANRLSEHNRAVSLLNDIINDVPFRIRRAGTKTHPLTGALGIYAESFIKQFTDEIRPSKQTMKRYMLSLSHFTARMELDKTGLKELSEVVVLRFFSSLQNVREYVSVPVRRFLRYLYVEGLIEMDLSIRLSTIKSHRAEKVPSFYSNDEIRKMDETIERNSPVGKRNYAMFLLASRLGMRSADIRHLQFGNIDWDRNILVFNQQKTGKAIELPLFTNIGEAIIDYIRNGRPQINNKTLFLQARAPFSLLTSTAVSVIISTIIYNAGIETKGRHHGSHSLRHSLATNLLKQGTALPVISGVLGHSSTESTMIYLHVDVDNLLRCSIDVPPIPDKFYMQKGGWFYV